MKLDIPDLDCGWLELTREIIGDIIDAKINFQALGEIRIETTFDDDYNIEIRFLYNDFVYLPSDEKLEEWYDGDLHRATFQHDPSTLAYLLLQDFEEKLRHKLSRLKLLQDVEIEDFNLLTYDSVGQFRRKYPDFAGNIGAEQCHFDLWGQRYILRTNVDVKLKARIP